VHAKRVVRRAIGGRTATPHGIVDKARPRATDHLPEQRGDREKRDAAGQTLPAFTRADVADRRR
jgi:hypothetical protein